jgi:hypothetical protein
MLDKTKTDKNRIYFIDSNGRVIGIEKKAIKATLKKRSIESVIEEVIYVLRKTKRSRNTTTIRDVALELGVHYFVVKAIMDALVKDKMVAYCDGCNNSILNEKYSILLKPFELSEED